MADFGVGDDDIDFTSDEEDVNAIELEKASEDAPVVRLVQRVLLERHQQGRERHSHRAEREGACACATASTACCTRR